MSKSQQLWDDERQFCGTRYQGMGAKCLMARNELAKNKSNTLRFHDRL